VNFTTSIISVGLLFVLAMPGYLLRRFKLLSGEIAGGLVTILLYIACPFLTISSFEKTEFSTGLLVNMVVVVVFGFVLLCGSWFISRVCFSFFPEDAEKRICVASGFLNNCSFMGIPVIQTFFPGNPEPVIYVSMFTVAFNLLCWTLLVYTITGDKKYIHLRRALINPGTITFLFAIPLLVFDINFPPPVSAAVNYLANMTTPLSMLVIGIRLAEIPATKLFTGKKIYWSSFVKLILVPFFSFGIIYFFGPIVGLSHTAAMTLYIVMAMPTGSFVMVFSERFGGHHETAAKCVFLSSILSIATIPVLMLFSPLI
jgi:predicted permease